jgi:hypothetical protein
VIESDASDDLSVVADITDRLMRRAAREGREFPAEPLKSGGGDGTSGGMSDDWKASVDSQLERLHGDVRNLLAYGIGAVAFILLAFSVAYVGLSTQISSVQTEQGKVTVRLDGMDKRLDDVDKRLDQMESKMDKILENTSRSKK